MTEREGVTKFRLAFRPAPPLHEREVREVNAWRTLLHRVGLIDRDPLRYGGVGFGNISRRLNQFDAKKGGRFVITGTQTSDIQELGPSHYVVVVESHPDENRIVAEGPIHPSSEAMTHGMIYSLRESVRFVVHAHSAAIWREARYLRLACTRASAAYGTPEMSDEVRRLFKGTAFDDHGVFVMGGHEDGVVSFGRTMDEAALPLFSLLARALAKG